MLLPDPKGTGNQVTPVDADDALERAVMSLVGDVATYKPGAKVVVFEGGGATQFDVEMVSALFPSFADQSNLISGGNKPMVRMLHEVLNEARTSGALPFDVFSIVDMDLDPNLDRTSSPNALSWDVYHIENYLLEPVHINRVLADSLGNDNPLMSEDEVDEALRGCAQTIMHKMVQHKLELHANEKLVAALDLGADPNSDDIAGELSDAIKRSFERISVEIGSSLSASELTSQEKEIRTAFEGDLDTGKWRKSFRGRDILSRFAGKYLSGTRYEHFRNLILSDMRRHGFEPEGMKHTIDRISSA